MAKAVRPGPQAPGRVRLRAVGRQAPDLPGRPLPRPRPAGPDRHRRHDRRRRPRRDLDGRHPRVAARGARAAPRPLFGAALPAAADIGALLEGYGLHVAEAPDPDPALRELDLPPLAPPTTTTCAAMALSLRALPDRPRRRRPSFRKLLAEARPGRLDRPPRTSTASGMSSLEEAWRREAGRPGGQGEDRAVPPPGPPLPAAPHPARGRDLRLHAPRPRLHDGVPVRLPEAARRRDPQRRVLRGAQPARPPRRRLRHHRSLAGLRRAVPVGLRERRRSCARSATQMFDRLQSSRRVVQPPPGRATCCPGCSPTSASARGRACRRRCGRASSRCCRWSWRPSCSSSSTRCWRRSCWSARPLVAVVYRIMSAGPRAQHRRPGADRAASTAWRRELRGPAGGEGVRPARPGSGPGSAGPRTACSTPQVRLQLFGGLFGLSVNMIVTFLRLVVLGLGAG